MPSRRQLRRQARTQGRLRYRPEAQGLRQLARQERRDLLDTTDSQRSAADAIVGSAREARGDIADIYENAGLTDAVRGALDSNPAARRLAEEMADAQVEMRQREVDAREGASFAINQATQQYRRNIKDIRNRQVSLKQEKGAFVSDLLQQLIGEQQAARAAAAADAQDLGLRTLNAGIDPTTGAPIPGGKLDPDGDGVLGGVKPKPKKKPKATGADRGASAALGKAKTWISKIDNPEYQKKVPDRAKRRAALQEILTVGDQASGIPALPQHVVEAALDMHFAGRLSPATVKMLRTLGIQVRRLPGVEYGPRQNQARPVGSNGKAPF